MKKTLLSIAVPFMITIASCKKTNHLEESVPKETKVAVATASLLFKGELDIKKASSQIKDEKARILIPFIPAPNEKSFRYKITELDKEGNEVAAGYVLSMEPITNSQKLFDLTIDPKGIALGRGIRTGAGNGARKDNVVAKVKMKNEVVASPMGEVLSVYAGCNNQPPVCIDWYFTTFDANTGSVVNETYVYTSCYDPCSFTSGGAGSTSPNSECANASSQLQSGKVSETNQVTPVAQSPTERTFSYHWSFHRQIFGWWEFVSHEIGVHKKENGVWKWKSLTHQSVSRTGFVFGASITCTVNSVTPQVGTFNAGVEINYTISSSIICKGFPITSDINYYGRSPIWHVDYTPQPM